MSDTSHWYIATIFILCAVTAGLLIAAVSIHFCQHGVNRLFYDKPIAEKVNRESSGVAYQVDSLPGVQCEIVHY